MVSLDTFKKILLILLAVLLSASLVWVMLLAVPTRSIEDLEDRLAVQAEYGQSYLDTSFTPEDPKVVLDPYKMSPLSALVIFETEQPESVKLEVVGKNELTTFKHTFEAAKQHRLPIYGLYPDYENIIKLSTGGQTQLLTIKTEPLPKDFPKTVRTQQNEQKLSDFDTQLYFMTPSSNKSRPAAYDVNGDVRWYLSTALNWEIERLENGHLLLGAERMVAKPYYSSGLYEIDLLGKIYREYMIPGGYHHDYHEKADGNLVIAANNLGPDSKQTVEDYVVEIDRDTGEVVKEIDLTEILPMDQGKSLEAWTEGDWFHNNSVYLDEESDSLILSGRHQDSVVSLDYETGKINYIIGSPDTWPADMKKYFLKPVGEDFEWQWQQHAASVLPGGDIMVLDNGTYRSKNEKDALPAEQNYTRAVIYRVDEEARTVEQTWQYGKQRGGEYFSPYISDADYLGEGHALVHSGGVSYKDGKLQDLPATIAKSDKFRSFTTEVLDDEVIFEIEIATNNYRAEKMPLYTEKDQSLDINQPAVRLGGLHKTIHQLVDSPIWYQLRPTIFSSDYKAADVRFSRDSDRLIMRANFHENDVVRIILKNSRGAWSYRVPMTDEIHTNAACIDTYDDAVPRGDEAEVEYFINDTGLSGRYDIYLKLNDQIYATNRDVRF